MLLLGGVAAICLAACGSSGGSSSSTASTSSGSTTASAPSGGGQTLKLNADPGGALMFNTTSLTASAGTVTMQMSNPSTSGSPHGIAITGNGFSKKGQIVNPGSTSTLTVNLKPGTYQYYCPFDSHRQMGMTGTLTVK